MSDLKKQPENYPTYGAWPRQPTREELNAPGAQPYVATVYLVPVESLRGSARRWNFNTAQYALQHPHDPDYAVIAYFGKCTHLGCTVGWYNKGGSDYDADGNPDGMILCPCHQGVFDVFNMAKNKEGTPPTRPLDVLRIQIGPWQDEAGTDHSEVILGTELIAQPTYRAADRQGDGAPYKLQQ